MSPLLKDTSIKFGKIQFFDKFWILFYTVNAYVLDK